MELIVDKATLTRIPGTADNQSPRSRVRIAGTRIDSPVNGAVLESCIRQGNHYLILTTDDCPFEETLNILLLDEANKPLDSATLSWPYATGLFRLLDRIEPDRILFQFLGEEIWTLKLLDRPQFFIPLISEPAGTWRKLQFRRHFSLSKSGS